MSTMDDLTAAETVAQKRLTTAAEDLIHRVRRYPHTSGAAPDGGAVVSAFITWLRVANTWHAAAAALQAAHDEVTR